MAESSWQGLPNYVMPDEATFSSNEDFQARNPHRGSAGSTRGRRNDHYDQQRGPSLPRSRSRPTSVASQQTNKSKVKHRSYHEADDYDLLMSEDNNNNAMRHPVENRDDAPHLEDSRGRKSQSESQGPVTTNFSRKGTSVRSRSTGASRADQANLSEISALPPLPQTHRFSQQTTTAGTRPPTAGKAPNPEQGDESVSTESPPYTGRKPQDLVRCEKPVPRWLTELYSISYLIFFAIWGTLARLGLQWITFYPGAPVTTPVIWANMAGSMVLGFLAEDQGLFSNHIYVTAVQRHGKEFSDLEHMDRKEHLKVKKTIPLYIGLSVGFCGSFTSFSSFARDFFLALSNNLPAPISHPHTLAAGAGTVSPSSTVSRNGGYSFEAMLGVMLSTLALSLGGLFVGAHTAIGLDKITPSLPVSLMRNIVDPSFVFLGWGCWLGAVFLAIWPPDRPSGPASRGTWANETWRGEVIFALVFAPLGCILRFYTSLKLNGLVAAFPLGTFAVNMFGTAIEGMCYDIQHVGVGIMGQIGGGRVGCQVLQGVMDGFCGCLTTVSTWVAEIQALRRRHGYFYAVASLLGGLGLLVVIMGSVRWAHGFSEPVCSTGYPSKVSG